MEDNLKNLSVSVVNTVQKINYKLQGNIVVVVLIGIILLWMFSIFSPTFIILAIILLNIYSLYFLYSKEYITINNPYDKDDE
jgi:hypothetical protein